EVDAGSPQKTRQKKRLAACDAGKVENFRPPDYLRGAARGSSEHPMMSYVEASSAPLRKTGQIKLYGAEAFAGMRRAGRLVAECLDMLVPEVKPGVPTDRIDRLGVRV